MESKYVGQYPSGRYEYTGTLADIQATAGPEGSMGFCTDSPDILRYRNGAWGTAGDLERSPDGSALVAPLPLVAPSVVAGGSAPTPWDVVVFGATPGGIAAAIRAKRNGASVILLESSYWLGGMLTGGIANTDSVVLPSGWSTGIHPGFPEEFYRRIAAHYLPAFSQFYFLKNRTYRTNLWKAKEVAQQMLNEAGVAVVYGAELASVSTSPATIGGVATNVVTSILTSRGMIYGRQFIDATYEGDLVAAAGCTTTIGREASATYTETGAGVTASTAYAGVDPYVTPGDAESGLLFGIDSAGPGAVGSADSRVQGVTYRFPLTKTGTKVAVTQPTDYDASKYEWFGRYAAVNGGAWTTLDDVLTLYGVGDAASPFYPNVDVNNRGPMSSNWVGAEATEYVTASYQRRREIAATVKSWVLGFLWFVRTDTRLPAAVRADAALYGHPVNEFREDGYFPPYLYVREGRRLVGDFVLSWTNAKADNAYTDPIAFTTYEADSHYCRRYISGGVVNVEGAMLNAPTVVGGRIPMRIIFPKAAEVANLVATFATSVSRMAFCSTRMEPTHMSVGEFAGAVAALAAKRGVAVQTITWAEVAPKTAMGRYLPNHPGDVLLFADNSRTNDGTVAQAGGVWNVSAAPRYGQCAKDAACLTAGATIKFSPKITTSGMYRVLVQFPCVPTSVNNTRTTAAPVNIVSAGGTSTLTLVQSGINACSDGNWLDLGTYLFRAAALGSDSADYVQFGTDGGGTLATWITAVKFERVA